MEICFELSQDFVELIALSTEEQNVDFGLNFETFFHNKYDFYSPQECDDELENETKVAILLEA